MPEWLGIAIAFIYGIVVGSFTNVCIWRMPRDESIVNPPSHCPQCDTQLRAWELIPLFSFLLQRGKCRHCGARISWRYFLVEMLVGAYFAFTFYWFHWGIDFITYALFGTALIAIFFIDLEHWIIPDQLTIFGMATGVLRDGVGLAAGYRHPYKLAVPGTGVHIPIPQSIAGILICGGIFFGIAVVTYYIFKKEGMGGGDIKLAAAIGANLALGPALLSFFLAVFLGSVIGVGLIVAGRKTRKDYVPFGPMMVAGALIALFVGQRIIDLYRSYMSIGL